ncbi:DUF6290 family protein [Tetragenococcus halophilus]|uniref:DUF6290 family protein n=1 Tax=Tetragenococcus halophilus TaxID=51669 RepID=UPI001F3809A6|nr:DUF6290 family protein [Tetragenococcus halophilus]MCF1684220.1 DUF6290 family protein [Tetragenococcus halophilus]
MVLTSLYFTDEQYREIKELAEFESVYVTEFMKRTILDRVQNENDYYEAVQNLKESHGETVSRGEVKRRLDLI